MKARMLGAALLAGLLLLLGFSGSSLTPSVAAQGEERYIVVLHGDSDPLAVAREHGVLLEHVYRYALNGFAGAVPPGRLTALQHDPRVSYVEADQPVQIFDQTVPTGIRRILAPGNGNIDIDGTDDHRVDVDVAVIDTGIDLDHPDLNVVASTNCSGGSPFKQSCGSGGDDDNNHGTHVAGTIAALDNGFGVVGVAPGARLWAVKVLKSDGSGFISWIIAGIDYVTANADKIEVANMSLGCECSSSAMDTAITNSVAAGVVYAVAAGNSDKDASTFSPAKHPDVITVSALADFDGEPGGLVGTSTSPPYCRVDQDDTLADFSNWGSLIKITAPGVCILSTIPGGYATYSGTSMASPHVAGAAALLASGASTLTPAQIRQTLIDNGNSNWTDDSGDGIQEPLLDVSNATVFAPTLVPGSGGGGGTSDTTPPVISWVAPWNVTASSADISWTTDEASDSVVRYGSTTTALGSEASNASLVTSHLIGLSGLSASTTYYFEVESTDSSDNTSVDNNGGLYYSFTTAASSSGATMHVGDLDGTASLKGKSGKWEATVTVTIHDAGHDGVPNASVTATWSGDKSGTVTGTTGTTGTVSFSTGAISNGTGSVTLTVDGVTHATLSYFYTDNHDLDVPVDSDGTTITVNKPT